MSGGKLLNRQLLIFAESPIHTFTEYLQTLWLLRNSFLSKYNFASLWGEIEEDPSGEAQRLGNGRAHRPYYLPTVTEIFISVL